MGIYMRKNMAAKRIMEKEILKECTLPTLLTIIIVKSRTRWPLFSMGGIFSSAYSIALS